MKEFIDYLVKNLVDNPDQVQIETYDGEQSTIVEIKVDPADIAKLVGRQGRIIKALRTLASTVSARMGRKIRLEIIQEPEVAATTTPE